MLLYHKRSAMLRSTALFLILSTPAMAEVPQVMTDIAPIQSLVARVMQGVGTPDVLLPPGASPHDFSMRPSDAERLAAADLIIWVGHGLTPWLEDPVETLAPDAAKLELLDTTGWTTLQVRADPEFAEEEHHDDEAEGDHDHNHAHSGVDPHAWLDPSNAAVFMTLIAQALATADPDNAAAYTANAAAAQGEMASLKAETLALLAPVAGGTYIVPHDGYQYFETAFGMPAAGAISLTDASTPGPARIAELQDKVASGAITCVLTDPQTSPEWTDVLRDGSIAKTAFVDPDGGSQAAGLDRPEDLYPAIIRQIAAGMADCLG
jgi:zinc transport system substrate-binding protein